MLSSEEGEVGDVISLNKDQIAGLLHHVRNKGEGKVGEMASQLDVSEDQLREFWQANRTRWPEVLAEAESVDRHRIASGAWTRNEDALIESEVYAQGKHTDWKKIAHRLGRTVSQVRQRYREEFSGKAPMWTPQDNGDLIALYRQLGPRWEQIAMRMNRTIIQVETRWRFLSSLPGSELREREVVPSDDVEHQELEDEQTAQRGPSM
jgi:hypothetical protein